MKEGFSKSKFESEASVSCAADQLSYFFRG
jgi:hypothetical protein